MLTENKKLLGKIKQNNSSSREIQKINRKINDIKEEIEEINTAGNNGNDILIKNFDTIFKPENLKN